MSRRIYVASSWRCDQQPVVVGQLRAAGHEVYDFRNPAPGNDGFAWSEIDPDWLGWTPRAFRDLLQHPVALDGFGLDYAAMEWADAFVLVLPCGRSAHLEAGWAIGKGKPTAILLHEERYEPELMYLMADLLAVDIAEVVDWLDEPASSAARTCQLDRYEIGLAIDAVASQIQSQEPNEFRPLLRKLQDAYRETRAA